MLRLATTTCLLLLCAACGDEAPPAPPPAGGPDAIWRVPRQLDTQAAGTRIALGGTLLGGRLTFGDTREAGVAAAEVDIALGRPRMIGFGNVAWSHTGLDNSAEKSGLPGLSGAGCVLTEGLVTFFQGYNETIRAEVQAGRLRSALPAERWNERGAFGHHLLDDARWFAIVGGSRAIEAPGSAGTLNVTPYEPAPEYAHLTYVPAGSAPRVVFAVARLPAEAHVHTERAELVLSEPGVMRVFALPSGRLLRCRPADRAEVRRWADAAARLRAEAAGPK